MIPALCVLAVVLWLAGIIDVGRAITRLARQPDLMPGPEGQNMPWPPPRELLYVRPTAGGFEMACGCSAVTRVRLGCYDLAEVSITCRCGASHWIDLTALEHA